MPTFYQCGKCSTICKFVWNFAGDQLCQDCFRRAKGIHWDTSEVAPNPERTVRIVKADGEIMEVDPVTGKEVKATEPVAAGDARTRKIRLVDQEK